MYHMKRKGKMSQPNQQNQEQHLDQYQDEGQAAQDQGQAVQNQDQAAQNQNQAAQNQNQAAHNNQGQAAPQNQHVQEDSTAGSDQFCFVHRLSGLPLISFSIEQLLYYYDKTKKYNRLLSASLHMAENTVKYAVGTTEPFRKLLDGPIVAANKLACHQLEKFEKRYPVIQITPDEIFQYGKGYYEHSLIKTGVDQANKVVVYGGNKVRRTKQLAGNVVTGLKYIGTLNFSEMMRLSLEAINQTLVYSDSVIDAYITPPNFEVNGQGDIGFTIVSRMYGMSTKIFYGLKYKAGNGIALTRDQAMQILGHMQAVLYLLDYAKNTTQWLTDEAITKISAVNGNVGNLLRDIKTGVVTYGKKPDLALLKVVQKATNTVVGLTDLVSKCWSPFLPQSLKQNVLLAVQYAHDLSETFNTATTLGELKDDVIKEAREKFGFVQSVLLAVFDRVVVYPPMSWLVSFSRNNGIIFKQNFINGEVADGGIKTRTTNNSNQ